MQRTSEETKVGLIALGALVLAHVAGPMRAKAGAFTRHWSCRDVDGATERFIQEKGFRFPTENVSQSVCPERWQRLRGRGCESGMAQKRGWIADVPPDILDTFRTAFFSCAISLAGSEKDSGIKRQQQAHD